MRPRYLIRFNPDDMKKRFHKPLDNLFVTQPFDVNWVGPGAYSFAKCNKRDHHTGIDFRAAIGTPVYAPDDGIVIGRGGQKDAIGGFYVSIQVREGDEGWIVYNGHLSKIKVKLYQKVKKGQVIALSGDSGRVAPHLHHGIMPITFTGKGKWDYYATYKGNGLCAKVDPAPFYEELFQPSKDDPVEHRYGRKDTWRARVEFAPHFMWLLKHPVIWSRVANRRMFNALKWGNWSLREIFDTEMEPIWSQMTKSEYLKRGGKL